MMIFTPVSHYKFMVIPFVYADKALYSVRFFPRTRYEVMYLTHRPTSSSGCINFFIFLLINQAHRLRQQLRYSKTSVAPNCGSELEKFLSIETSHSMLDDKARLRERYIVTSAIVGKIYDMYKFCKTHLGTCLHVDTSI